MVVYTGDDEQFEYIYRYVSNQPWRRARRRGINPLDDGILYVAKFLPDGWGEWLPLTPNNPALAGWSYNDILINTRGAADLAGATPMDRPEWIDTFDDDLTAARHADQQHQPRGRRDQPADRASRILVSTPPTRGARNAFGHIIRWSYEHDFSEPVFYWDIFTLAGDPDPNNPVPDDGANVNGDKFGSPDGLYVAPSGRLWIQTDVSGSTINTGPYAGFGNNQMLCADPGTKEVRRFLTGPKVCEITGVFVTPDERTMFVGIQHPGEAPTGVNDPANPKQFSSWPDGPGRRTAAVVVHRDHQGRRRRDRELIVRRAHCSSLPSCRRAGRVRRRRR